MYLSISHHSFESVNEFKYLEALCTETYENKTEIKARMILLLLETVHLMIRNTKLTINKTIIKPVVFYDSEIWPLHFNEEGVLAVWERIVLRQIFGPVE